MAILFRVVLACSILITAIPKATAGEKKGPVRIEELLALIAKTDTVVVYNKYTDGLGKILYASSHRKDISTLGEAISIADLRDRFMCLCGTSPEVVLYHKRKVLEAVSKPGTGSADGRVATEAA